MKVFSRGKNHIRSFKIDHLSINNIFVSILQNQVHVNIGGGRDNIIRNNIFYNATSYAMQVDSRGIKGTNDATLLNELKVKLIH